MSILRRFLGRVRRRLFPQSIIHQTEAYSQEGEDLILQRIFMDKATGFYADVGAHHPTRFSNTYLFYRRGWSGLNIDAMPGSMAAFEYERPRDRNVEAAVGRDSEAPRTYWIFNEPALNTFDEALARSRQNEAVNHAIIGTKEVLTRSLRGLLDEHLPAGTAIDFLTVDVEGLDLEVLQSNDWERHRPHYVLTECYGVLLPELPEEPICAYLLGQGYKIFAKTVNTVLFKDAR